MVRRKTRRTRRTTAPESRMTQDKRRKTRPQASRARRRRASSIWRGSTGWTRWGRRTGQQRAPRRRLHPWDGPHPKSPDCPNYSRLATPDIPRAAFRQPNATGRPREPAAGLNWRGNGEEFRAEPAWTVGRVLFDFGSVSHHWSVLKVGIQCNELKHFKVGTNVNKTFSKLSTEGEDVIVAPLFLGCWNAPWFLNLYSLKYFLFPS